MKTRILLLAAAAAMAFTAISCSKDDGNDPTDPGNKVPDPEGTVELNMRNADNGKTFLGGYIYIDAANNFSGFLFVDLGEMKGLGNITQFTTAGNSGSCAVIPGHGYLAYSNYKYNYRTFPSGKKAYIVGLVYRIYVDSYILSAANTILGAKIKYQSSFNPEGLPLTLEEYIAADPEVEGWEVETDGRNIYIRKNEMYVSLWQ